MHISHLKMLYTSQILSPEEYLVLINYTLDDKVHFVKCLLTKCDDKIYNYRPAEMTDILLEISYEVKISCILTVFEL